MKLAVECECILMQKSLELFLCDFISSEPDFIVSDVKMNTNKQVFLIENYLNLPFTRETLLEVLEEYSFGVNSQIITQEPLEDKISNLIDEFKLRLIKTIKDHYE